jgi:hypothetical protein
MGFLRRRERPHPPMVTPADEAVTPHCDARVLHAPGTCFYCDQHPQWQQLRMLWGVAFTGRQPADGEIACPSDFLRGLNASAAWPGNRARRDPT